MSDAGWNEPDSQAQQLADLLDENERLRAALADALEGLREMRPYVNDYFAEKWDHGGYVTRAEQALGKNR